MFSEIIISFFLVLAGFFGLVGSVGMIKLERTMQRLHAPTKATSLGVGGVLIASMLYFSLEKGHLSFHELLITLFLLLTAPVSAHFIAKTYIQAKMKPEDLPGSDGDFGWAIYDNPPTYLEED
ncbi:MULTISPECIES: Na+/H+ antiporter subunit G [unclassified Shimia]|uniref:Na+/H+ antiporter subunit G n=1 Tax=unclassified Shimia TaxID=2630038 RepID=UPI00310AA0EA